MLHSHVDMAESPQKTDVSYPLALSVHHSLVNLDSSERPRSA